MTDPVPVARYLYIGTTVLGYTERDVWKMPLNKLTALYTEHLKETGQYKRPETTDDLMP